MSRWATILILALSLVLAACAQAPNKTGDQSTGTQSSQSTDGAGKNTATATPKSGKTDSVTVQGTDGTKTTFSSELSPELKNFPVPSGFTPDSSGSMSQGGDKLSVASWKGKGDAAKVWESLGKSMTDAGWKEEYSFSADTGGQRAYSKGDQSLIVTLSKEGEDLTISVLQGKSTQKPTAEPTKGQQKATPTQAPSSSGSKPEPTDTPAAPKTTGASAIPEPMRDIPVPNGFSVIADSAMSVSQNGKVSLAGYQLFGKTPVKDVSDFYRKELPGKGWTEGMVVNGDTDFTATYVDTKTTTMHLTVVVEATDAGTQVTVNIVVE